METFNNANLRQFQTLQHIIDNSDEEHITCIINILIQSDKIDTPYYLDTKIKITHCAETINKVIVHAMDVLENHRMYNITEEKYNQIKTLVDKLFEGNNDLRTKTEITPQKDGIQIITMNKKKLQKTLNEYENLFQVIDDLS